MKGEFVTVILNDQKVVDNAQMDNYFERNKPLPEEGPIQLQTHGGEIQWKNVFIKAL